MKFKRNTELLLLAKMQSNETFNVNTRMQLVQFAIKTLISCR